MKDFIKFGIRPFLLCLSLLFLGSLVVVAQSDIEECTSTPPVGVNCTFFTPPLICSNLVYDILNTTGDEVVNNASLEVHNVNTSTYKFNFTLVDSVADYQIVLCDGTFREVRVGGDGVTTPSIVTGQIIFLSIIALAAVVFFVITLMYDNAVTGMLSGTAFIIVGAALFVNPFDFSVNGFSSFGKASFIGLASFGIGLIVFGIYVLLSSVNLFFKSRSLEVDPSDFNFG